METPKTNLAVVFAIALAAMVTTALVAGLLPAIQRIQSSGNVKTLGIAVYSNEECTLNLTSIDWGFVEAGRNYTKTIWVKNTGNTQVTLNMTTESWNPANAKNYIALNWNREATSLSVGQKVSAVLTLSVSASATQAGITTFSFTIVIKGS